MSAALVSTSVAPFAALRARPPPRHGAYFPTRPPVRVDPSSRAPSTPQSDVSRRAPRPGPHPPPHPRPFPAGHPRRRRPPASPALDDRTAFRAAPLSYFALDQLELKGPSIQRGRRRPHDYARPFVKGALDGSRLVRLVGVLPRRLELPQPAPEHRVVLRPRRPRAPSPTPTASSTPSDRATPSSSRRDGGDDGTSSNTSTRCGSPSPTTTSRARPTDPSSSRARRSSRTPLVP